MLPMEFCTTTQDGMLYVRKQTPPFSSHVIPISSSQRQRPLSGQATPKYISPYFSPIPSPSLHYEFSSDPMAVYTNRTNKPI